MARIRSVGNQTTEVRLLKLMRSAKISGWRRNQKISGKPDFVFREKRIVIFVDGCFWHGCPRCYHRPKSNQGYWKKQFLRNRERDHENNVALRKLGWRVLRIWEHELIKNPHRCVERITRVLVVTNDIEKIERAK